MIPLDEEIGIFPKKTRVFIVIKYLLYSKKKGFMTVELHEMN